MNFIQTFVAIRSACIACLEYSWLVKHTSSPPDFAGSVVSRTVYYTTCWSKLNRFGNNVITVPLSGFFWCAWSCVMFTTAVALSILSAGFLPPRSLETTLYFVLFSGKILSCLRWISVSVILLTAWFGMFCLGKFDSCSKFVSSTKALLVSSFWTGAAVGLINEIQCPTGFLRDRPVKLHFNPFAQRPMI